MLCIKTKQEPITKIIASICTAYKSIIWTIQMSCFYCGITTMAIGEATRQQFSLRITWVILPIAALIVLPQNYRFEYICGLLICGAYVLFVWEFFLRQMKSQYAELGVLVGALLFPGLVGTLLT